MPQLILYHGTSRAAAELIRANGFKPSASGCLGAGVYVAHHDKAFKFAADCRRHEGDAGVVVKVKVTFRRAKYVRGDDQGWRSEGFDACRAEWTSASTNMEWCLASPKQVELLAIQPVPCGAPAPAFDFEQALSLDSVRQLAVAEGMEEVFFSKRDKVVSFAPSLRSEKRVNVFYATGTVGAAYAHPRQCFRRKADMQILGQLFRASARSCDCLDAQQRHAHAQESPSSRVAVGAEEAEVRATLERLRKETEEVEAILRDHQLRREEQARREAEAKRREKEERRLEAERRAAEQRRRQEEERQRQEEAKLRRQRERGSQCAFFIPQAWHKDTKDNFYEDTLSVALGADCIFMLHEGAAWTWNGSVPKLLHNKLHGRQRSLPAPTYLSIGSVDRYYISFADGKSEWVGPDGLTEELNGSSRTVRSVAFGEDWDTFFVVYTDGYWKWEGDVPSGLLKVLKDRNNKSDLTHVSLGPTGQYYVSVANRRAWWGGMSDENYNTIRPYKDRITFMDFGGDDNLFVRYE